MNPKLPIVFIALAAGSAATATAQTSSGNRHQSPQTWRDNEASSSQNVSQNHNQGGSIRVPSELRRKLRDQGYTNIEIAPGSYVINAKDPDGDRVVMLLGPHSATVISGFSSNSSSREGYRSGSSMNRSSGRSNSQDTDDSDD